MDKYLTNLNLIPTYDDPTFFLLVGINSFCKCSILVMVMMSEAMQRKQFEKDALRSKIHAWVKETVS